MTEFVADGLWVEVVDGCMLVSVCGDMNVLVQKKKKVVTEKHLTSADIVWLPFFLSIIMWERHQQRAKLKFRD